MNPWAIPKSTSGWWRWWAPGPQGEEEREREGRTVSRSSVFPSQFPPQAHPRPALVLTTGSSALGLPISHQLCTLHDLEQATWPLLSLVTHLWLWTECLCPPDSLWWSPSHAPPPMAVFGGRAWEEAKRGYRSRGPTLRALVTLEEEEPESPLSLSATWGHGSLQTTDDSIPKWPRWL